MTEWSRPDGDLPRDVPHVEVPLAGPDADPAAFGDRPVDEGRAPNWRRVAGLSALAGIALGAVVSVVLLATDGSSDDATPTTTLDPDELAEAITVPPTLPPITGPAPQPSATEATVPTDELRAVQSVETLPPLNGTIPQPDTFRLTDGSLAALDTPTARRSVTEHVVGVDGFEQIVTITNDPETGRYLLEFDSGVDAVQSVIVDLPGGDTYVRMPDREWSVVPNEEIAENAGAPDMATFLRTLQLGPIRSDTRTGWSLVQANSIVDAPGEALREYVVVLAAGAVPEWARYALGPTGEAPPITDDTKIGYAVYVARDGSIRRVSGSTEFGATTQRVVHRIETLDVPPVIELPDVSAPDDSSPTGTGSVP